MQKYIWRHFPGSDDWGLFPRGIKNLEEDTAVVILSRMNRYFPWTVYVNGEENKQLASELPSDSLKDIKEYILAHLDSIINEKLTEADEDDIMSDDELDELERKERDELEARLKARRDKVAQDRFARDEKARKEAELQAKAEEIQKQIGGDYQFEHLFDILVPSSGKCESLAGELIRAVNKIEYRFFNDGDRWFEDYGIETAGPAAMFVINFEHQDEIPFWDFMINWAESNAEDSEYEARISQIKQAVSEYIEEHPEILAMETKDMYDIKVKDVEEFLDEHSLIPTYECDADFPDELQAHLDKGNVSERDVQWEVESWLENMGDYNADVSVNDYVYIENMKKSSYDDLYGNLYKWLQEYAEQLTQEYGDPSEEENEEEE